MNTKFEAGKVYKSKRGREYVFVRHQRKNGVMEAVFKDLENNHICTHYSFTINGIECAFQWAFNEKSHIKPDFCADPSIAKYTFKDAKLNGIGIYATLFEVDKEYWVFNPYTGGIFKGICVGIWHDHTIEILVNELKQTIIFNDHVKYGYSEDSHYLLFLEDIPQLFLDRFRFFIKSQYYTTPRGTTFKFKGKVKCEDGVRAIFKKDNSFILPKLYRIDGVECCFDGDHKLILVADEHLMGADVNKAVLVKEI